MGKLRQNEMFAFGDDGAFPVCPVIDRSCMMERCQFFKDGACQYQEIGSKVKPISEEEQKHREHLLKIMSEGY